MLICPSCGVMARRLTPELRELMAAFRLEVVYGGSHDARPLPCWFAEVDERPCEGPIRAAHFIKRQRVRNALGALGYDAELIDLAQWDPRVAVPSCQLHDDRWDGHAMPPLVIFREQVPNAVEAFAADWGLESSLASKCPPLSADRPLDTKHETGAV
jgi:hypothetical protein